MHIEILMLREMDSIKKNTSDPSEIRAKKISRGRQDIQDHMDRGAFGPGQLPQPKKIPVLRITWTITLDDPDYTFYSFL